MELGNVIFFVVIFAGILFTLGKNLMKWTLCVVLCNVVYPLPVTGNSYSDSDPLPAASTGCAILSGPGKLLSKTSALND